MKITVGFAIWRKILNARAVSALCLELHKLRALTDFEKDVLPCSTERGRTPTDCVIFLENTISKSSDIEIALLRLQNIKKLPIKIARKIAPMKVKKIWLKTIFWSSIGINRVWLWFWMRKTTETITKSCALLVCLWFFLFLLTFFLRFSLDACQGRISNNTRQISLKPTKILPLRISSDLTPVSRCFFVGLLAPWSRI